MRNECNKRLTILSAILAALGMWRLPVAFGLKAGDALLGSHAISLALAVGLFFLSKYAFACRDRRLQRFAYGLGLVFALMTVVGEHLEANGAFVGVTWLSALDGTFVIVLMTLCYGSALVLLGRGVDALAARAPGEKAESLFSKIIGNGFVVFALVLLCWLPSWLACWPGSFGADSLVQFCEYMDETYSTHHPLLHTLFLGFLMMTGIDMDAEGSAAAGLALYSVVQMVLMAAIVGYACWWLRRRRAPMAVRVTTTLFFALFPFYGLWSFNAVKDVLFAGFGLLLTLHLVDLWRDGYALLRSPLRVAGFVLSAVMMMLLRNNGVYALCLLVPFAIVWAKGARWRIAALLAGCVAVYLAANGALVSVTEAESGSVVEMLPLPLQQIARTLRDDPEALQSEEDRELIDALYGGVSPAEYYSPTSADPVKWSIDYDLLSESVPRLLSLWARLGVTHLQTYAEAFLVQNLPYYLPGAETIFRLDLGLTQIDMYPMEADSRLPEYHDILTKYDDTQTFLGLPGVRLLSDTAFMAWICLAGLAYAAYRRQKGFMAAFGFLVAFWLTCLLGPIAAMRYVIVMFYAAPILWAALTAPRAEKSESLPR